MRLGTMDLGITSFAPTEEEACDAAPIKLTADTRIGTAIFFAEHVHYPCSLPHWQSAMLLKPWLVKVDMQRYFEALTRIFLVALPSRCYCPAKRLRRNKSISCVRPVSPPHSIILILLLSLTMAKMDQ